MFKYKLSWDLFLKINKLISHSPLISVAELVIKEYFFPEVNE